MVLLFLIITTFQKIIDSIDYIDIQEVVFLIYCVSHFLERIHFPYTNNSHVMATFKIFSEFKITMDILQLSMVTEYEHFGWEGM